MRIISKLLELKQQQGFMRYFKNTSWLFAEKILRMVVGLFVGIWIARYLGPEQFGLLNYAQSFVSLFIVFSTLGLNGIVVKELVLDLPKRDILLGTAFILKLVGSLIAIALIAFVMLLQETEPVTIRLIFIIGASSIFQSVNVIDFYFQSRTLGKFVVFSNAVSLSFSTLLKVYLLINDGSLIAFAYVSLFDSLILACGYIYFYHKNKLTICNWKFNFSIAKNLLHSSWPLILSGVAVSIYMKSDQIMLANLIGNKEVGLYAVAVKLSEMWLFITVAITNSLFPAILNTKVKSQVLYEGRMENLYRLLLLISITISIFMYLLSSPIIYYSFGNEYVGAAPILQWYVWSIIFIFLNNGAWKWYLAEGLQRIAIVRLSIGALVNVLLNYILIRKYGVEGAAYSTLISYSIAIYFGNLFFKKTRKNFWMQTYALFSLIKLRIK